MRSRRGRPPGASGWLYAGVVLFLLLLAFTVRSVWRESRAQVGEARADALYQLVRATAPSRPTDTPGATAWLLRELERHQLAIADRGKAALYGELVAAREAGLDGTGAPPALEPLRRVLARPVETDPCRSCAAVAALPGVPPAAEGSLRRTFLLRRASDSPSVGDPGKYWGDPGKRWGDPGERWFVVTRRRSLGDPSSFDPASAPADADRFLATAVPHLAALAARLGSALAERPLPAVPEDRPPVVVRLYALSEDGTLVTLPAPLAASEAERRAATLAEARELAKLPLVPTFVSNEFFFRFDFASDKPQSFYSGLYLDLGGQGLVATLTAPVLHPAAAEPRWLVGADVQFAVDWGAFAHQVEPPMSGVAVRLPQAALEHGQPWGEIRAALSGEPSSPLVRAVTALAAAEPTAGVTGARARQPNVLHGLVEGQGAVAAFQVAATTWLVLLFPRSAPHLPWIPVLLSAVMLGLLLVGFESNRRRAERAQRRAEGEFSEKQNLLNTMQVPLIVVDPNTDEVVSSNRAAQSLGLLAGTRMAERVEAEARDHYQSRQVAGSPSRRAYGVPLRVLAENGGEETRYAVVRSVAVTAPIEALEADERHRLGILFLLEPEADLALWSSRLAAETRRDEQRKLSGLLTHGVDTLARVLAFGLETADRVPPELQRWLAGYLEQRLATTSWLLGHWDAEPPLPPDSTIERAQVEATLAGLEAVFALAAADPALRARLHWDNGLLAAAAPRSDSGDGRFRLAVDLDWPAEFWFPCPVRGGFGYFLSEVLINAVRHGRPGSVPSVRAELDRVRRELTFTVENAVPNDSRGGDLATTTPRLDGYGGRRILERLAALFDWRDLGFTMSRGHFTVRWVIPVSRRGEVGKAD